MSRRRVRKRVLTMWKVRRKWRGNSLSTRTQIIKKRKRRKGRKRKKRRREAISR